jgi:hypothetical protein
MPRLLPGTRCAGAICDGRRLDLWYQRHLGWAEEYLGFKPLKELPATYVRENIYFTVQYERVAVEQLARGAGAWATSCERWGCPRPRTRGR